MTSFEPGSLLSGKYRVERLLGKGGMGVVLLATHVELDARVAVKVLPATAETSDEVVGRFLREAQAASKLKSEYVARVTDFGRLEDGQPFMVMELLEGEDFDALIEAGELSQTEAVDAAVQACAALAEAHAVGIIHRDVKPSNLFRTTRSDGSQCVKVLDFGISKVAPPEGDKPLTSTGRFMGTPLYMSPEHLRSPRDVDARTDVWSVGVTLYQMLAGEPPFVAEEMSTLLVCILETEPKPLQEARPQISADLAKVVHRCLEKDREKRVQSMGELARLLAPFASLEGGMAARRSSIALDKSAPMSQAKSSPRAIAHKRELQAGLAETMDAGSVSVENASEAQVARGGAYAAATSNTRASAADLAPSASPVRSRPRWSIAAAAALVASLGVIAVTVPRGDEPQEPGAREAKPPPATLAATDVGVPALPGVVVSPQATESASPSAPQPGAPRPSASAKLVAPRPPFSGAKPAASSAPRPAPTTLF